MWYSHYWHRVKELDRAEFSAFGEEVKLIIENARAAGVPAGSPEGDREPTITDEEIAFYASGDTDGLPLVIERVAQARPGAQLSNGLWFESCKTQQASYDVAVTAVLTAAHERWG